MNTKLPILFFVKRTKTNVDVLLPIFIRVTVNGERIEFSTKRFTTSEKWSVEGNRMKGTSTESKSTNLAYRSKSRLFFLIKFLIIHFYHSLSPFRGLGQYYLSIN